MGIVGSSCMCAYTWDNLKCYLKDAAYRRRMRRRCRCSNRKPKRMRGQRKRSVSSCSCTRPHCTRKVTPRGCGPPESPPCSGSNYPEPEPKPCGKPCDPTSPVSCSRRAKNFFRKCNVTTQTQCNDTKRIIDQSQTVPQKVRDVQTSPERPPAEPCPDKNKKPITRYPEKCPERTDRCPEKCVEKCNVKPVTCSKECHVKSPISCPKGCRSPPPPRDTCGKPSCPSPVQNNNEKPTSPSESPKCPRKFCLLPKFGRCSREPSPPEPKLESKTCPDLNKSPPKSSPATTPSPTPSPSPPSSPVKSCKTICKSSSPIHVCPCDPPPNPNPNPPISSCRFVVDAFFQ